MLIIIWLCFEINYKKLDGRNEMQTLLIASVAFALFIVCPRMAGNN